jgi:hypothetical protein
MLNNMIPFQLAASGGLMVASSSVAHRSASVTSGRRYRWRTASCHVGHTGTYLFTEVKKRTLGPASTWRGAPREYTGCCWKV